MNEEHISHARVVELWNESIKDFEGFDIQLLKFAQLVYEEAQRLNFQTS